MWNDFKWACDAEGATATYLGFVVQLACIFAIWPLARVVCQHEFDLEGDCHRCGESVYGSKR